MREWLLVTMVTIVVGSTVSVRTAHAAEADATDTNRLRHRPALQRSGSDVPHARAGANRPGSQQDRRPIFSDSFDRADGALGLPWTKTASTWGVRSSRAQLLSGIYASTTATATVDVGTTNVTVAADITLSSRRQRANAGLTTAFVDYRNNLYCKIEVTVVNPHGLMSIGRKLNGTTTSRLVAATRTGFVNGGAYHVVCVRAGSTITMTVGARTITYTLTAADLAVFGSTTKVGLRAHLASDEDDGGSRYDNFKVTSP